MKKILLPIFALVAMVFAACGGDDTAPAKIAVTGITLDKTMVALEIGEEATVKATVEPAKASNKKVEWSVADATIASVNNGAVKGLKEGETTITAKAVDGGFTASVAVKVVTEKIPVTGIDWQNTTSNIKEGKFAFFVAEISPANATDLSTIWESDNPEVASIGEIKTADNFIMAYIWGVAPGKATISVTTNDGGFKRYCPITIDPIVKVTEINLWPTSAEIEAGQTEQLTAAVLPSDAENKEIEWSSSDTSVATVDANGLVTGVAKGEATITATAKDGSGVKASTTVTVTGAKPTALTINGAKNPDYIYAWHGKEVVLDLACTPANADISKLYWDIHTDSDAANADAMKYEFTANTLKLSFEHSQSTSADETIYVRAWDSEEESTYYGGINVAYKTLGWLFDARYKFDVHSSIFPFAGKGDDMEKFNWNKDDYTSGLNFIAYYYTDGLANVVSPYNEGTQHYYEYYIPSSEYTLTSSDESKIKVTKNDDGKSWKIERLNTTDLVAVTLTYKCGEHTQTYTINLIP